MIVNDAGGAELLPLNELGESSDVVIPAVVGSTAGVEPLDLQEDSPSGDYITQFEAMADPRFNYHFAYEGVRVSLFAHRLQSALENHSFKVSESDGSTSRRNSNSNEESGEVASTTTTHTGGMLSSKYAAAVQSTDWNVAEVELKLVEGASKHGDMKVLSDK
jgi:hypothetical protein